MALLQPGWTSGLQHSALLCSWLLPPLCWSHHQTPPGGAGVSSPTSPSALSSGGKCPVLLTRLSLPAPGRPRAHAHPSPPRRPLKLRCTRLDPASTPGARWVGNAPQRASTGSGVGDRREGPSPGAEVGQSRRSPGPHRQTGPWPRARPDLRHSPRALPPPRDPEATAVPSPSPEIQATGCRVRTRRALRCPPTRPSSARAQAARSLPLHIPAASLGPGRPAQAEAAPPGPGAGTRWLGLPGTSPLLLPSPGSTPPHQGVRMQAGLHLAPEGAALAEAMLGGTGPPWEPSLPRLCPEAAGAGPRAARGARQLQPPRPGAHWGWEGAALQPTWLRSRDPSGLPRREASPRAWTLRWDTQDGSLATLGSTLGRLRCPGLPESPVTAGGGGCLVSPRHAPPAEAVPCTALWTSSSRSRTCRPGGTETLPGHSTVQGDASPGHPRDSEAT